MTESAARLVDGVLPRVPVRRWVLSLPHRLRYLLAWDHALSRAVPAVYARVVLGFHTLVFDGVFTEVDGEALRFQPMPPTTDEEVGVVPGQAVAAGPPTARLRRAQADTRTSAHRASASSPPSRRAQ